MCLFNKSTPAVSASTPAVSAAPPTETKSTMQTTNVDTGTKKKAGKRSLLIDQTGSSGGGSGLNL